MTPEQIQETISNILKIQAELQQSQLRQEGEIKNLLEVQAELQQSQLRQESKINDILTISERHSEQIEDLRAINRETLQTIRESHRDLAEIIEQSNRKIERQISNLVGYSLTAESDRLNIQERIRYLEKRIDRLEDNIK